jgi:ABC-type polysaccharide/polyol phosphate transport system ATPase subunit
MPAIQVHHLSKRYRIYDSRWQKLRDALGWGAKKYHREFWALDDITFDLEPGQTLGIIGQNGSGKSTLLQILAGIMFQTKGECVVNGKISALLELGSGFNPEFTGRENVFMNGAILGLDWRQMEKRFDAVTTFAEIGSFIDQPVKTYSSGMFMRLAFAVAVNVDPDILLVDEALAVGDLIFQHRCMHRMNSLRNSGKTIVLVTHDLDAITKFCDRALLLDAGHILEDGKAEIVVQKYRALIFERERRHGNFENGGKAVNNSAIYSSPDEMPIARTIPNVDHRFGNTEATVLGVELLDDSGNSTREVFGGQKAIIRISVQCNRDIDTPIIGFTLRDRMGIEISASNTSFIERYLPPAREGQIMTSDFQINFPLLAAGSYSISPAVAKGSILMHDMCDWIDNALVFTIRTQELVYGIVRMEMDARNYVSQNGVS